LKKKSVPAGMARPLYSHLTDFFVRKILDLLARQLTNDRLYSFNGSSLSIISPRPIQPPWSSGLSPCIVLSFLFQPIAHPYQRGLPVPIRHGLALVADSMHCHEPAVSYEEPEHACVELADMAQFEKAVAD
jgi:hypothetical protein